MRALIAVLLAGLVCASGWAHAQVGRGVESGRASGADVAQLARDLGRLSNAERAFQENRHDVEGVQLQDRQRLLLGLDASVSAADAAAEMKAWWIEHVLQPALDIAGNPAASCSLARSMLRRILEIAKQAQFLGVDGVEFGSLGDTDSIIARAIRIAKERCLVEAYDECLETGNGQVFFDLLKSFRFAPLESENDAQIEYLFRRCTVYTLVYHLDLSSVWTKGAETEQVSGVIQGSYTLLYASQGGGDSLTRLASGEWRGPPETQIFSNALLSHLSCGPNCSIVITDSPIDETAKGVISMKRVVREMRPRVAYETAYDQALGGRLVWERVEEQTGRNAINLRFEPPQFHTVAQHRTPTQEYDTGGVDSEIFYMATGRAAEPLHRRLGPGRASRAVHRPDVSPTHGDRPAQRHLPGQPSRQLQAGSSA